MLILIDVSIDLMQQRRTAGTVKDALDAQIGRFAIGLSQIQQQGRIGRK